MSRVAPRTASQRAAFPHVPQRKCCVCGTKAAALELVRVAFPKGAEPCVDTDRKNAGRGAYLCRSAPCIERAFERKSLERALKFKGNLPNELKNQLREIAGQTRTVPQTKTNSGAASRE